MDFSVTPGLLSFLSILAGILSIISMRRLPRMTRSSLLVMFQVGLSLLAPALLMFGVIYWYFTNNLDLDIFTRQYYVRLILLYLFLALTLWQVFNIGWGRKL